MKEFKVKKGRLLIDAQTNNIYHKNTDCEVLEAEQRPQDIFDDVTSYYFTFFSAFY